MNKEEKSFIPMDWNYNPSSWNQRIPILTVALAGAGIASYLTCYQLRIIDTVWEPFFGNGSEKILNSGISKLLPIPDAMLGTLGYFADFFAGIIGGKKRWRTMPWIVIVFGLAVGPLGIVSLILVILQPVLFDSWCTLCLASASISVFMIGPSLDEVLASLQFLKRAKQSGYPLLKTFWGNKEIVNKIE